MSRSKGRIARNNISNSFGDEMHTGTLEGTKETKHQDLTSKNAILMLPLIVNIPCKAAMFLAN